MSTRLERHLAEAERLLAEHVEKSRDAGTENEFANRLVIISWRHHIEELRGWIAQEQENSTNNLENLC